jgi:hypothetical protein
MGKDYNKAINTKYKPTDEELEREGYTSEKQWPYTFNIPKRNDFIS